MSIGRYKSSPNTERKAYPTLRIVSAVTAVAMGKAMEMKGVDAAMTDDQDGCSVMQVSSHLLNLTGG